MLLAESNYIDNIKEIYINGLKSDIKNKLYDKGYNTLDLSIDIKNDDEYKVMGIEIKLEKVEENEIQNDKFHEGLYPHTYLLVEERNLW